MNKKNIISSIASRIKQLREFKGYSQEYLAQKLNVTQSQYCRIEKNASDMSLEKIQKICETLEVSMIELLDENRSSASYFYNKESPQSQAQGNIIIHNYPKDLLQEILKKLDKLENK